MNNKVLFVAFEEGLIDFSLVELNEIKAFIEGAQIIKNLVRDPPLLFQYPKQAEYINAILDEEWEDTDKRELIKNLMAEIDEELSS